MYCVKEPNVVYPNIITMNENIPFSSFYQLETVLHKALWVIRYWINSVRVLKLGSKCVVWYVLTLSKVYNMLGKLGITKLKCL